MRKKIFILLLLLIAGVCNAAIDWDIYSDETITTGEYGVVSIYDSLDIPPVQTTVEIYGGEILLGINTYDTSITNIYGGTINSLYMMNSSEVHLYGGDISTITVDDLSNLNVYGYGFDYTGSGSTGSLAGFWADSSEFSILLRNTTYPSSQIVLHEIPEPVSFCLFAASFIGIRLIRSKH